MASLLLSQHHLTNEDCETQLKTLKLESWPLSLNSLLHIIRVSFSIRLTCLRHYYKFSV